MTDANNNSEFTEMFLRAISTHLSSRPECKQVEFEVNISENNSVSLYPKTYMVFPDRYSKKDANKLAVTDHVSIDHFNCFQKTAFQLVPGEYVYKLSVNGKQRRWHRKELNK